VCVAELSRAGGPPDPAAWARAADRFAGLRLPFELGYTRWRQAEALVLGPGDRSGAVKALREAAEIAATPPAPLLAAEVDRLARRARLSLDSPPPATESSAIERLGLSDREQTVLALVAEGQTNREIGAALFISEKTASVHVSRILAKLGVRSRVEAATAAHRLGLV
jgi:DNA-binding NarL/FixJ family response regulator